MLVENGQRVLFTGTAALVQRLPDFVAAVTFPHLLACYQRLAPVRPWGGRASAAIPDRRCGRSRSNHAGRDKRMLVARVVRSWRASLFRKRGTRFLGHVNAPDREAAKIAAVEWFKLDDEQRRRLVVQERA
jgi:hypothetical protein